MGKDKYFCPNCAATVDYNADRKRVSLHQLPSDPTKRCPATKLNLALELDPDAPIPGLIEVQTSPIVEKVPAKSSRRNRTRSIREPRERRAHWKDDYFIKCEDSWGIDDLGQEGGEHSVRARSGGRVESRRSKY